MAMPTFLPTFPKIFNSLKILFAFQDFYFFKFKKVKMGLETEKTSPCLPILYPNSYTSIFIFIMMNLIQHMTHKIKQLAGQGPQYQLLNLQAIEEYVLLFQYLTQNILLLKMIFKQIINIIENDQKKFVSVLIHKNQRHQLLLNFRKFYFVKFIFSIKMLELN